MILYFKKIFHFYKTSPAWETNKSAFGAQAVSHSTSIQGQRCLTSVTCQEPVHCTCYGRNRQIKDSLIWLSGGPFCVSKVEFIYVGRCAIVPSVAVFQREKKSQL